MWTRRDIKEKAKKGFYKNYWTTVCVCFVLALVCGVNSSSTDSATAKVNDAIDYKEVAGEYYTVEDSDNYSIIKDMFGLDAGPFLGSQEGLASDFFNAVTRGADAIFSLIGSFEFMVHSQWLSSGILMIASLLSAAFVVFISWPLMAGGMRYYLDICEEIPDLKFRICLCMFRRGAYWGSIKIMFFRSLQLTLWWLTVIGGIIKTYEYRAIPYLVAENPNLTRSEAFAMAKDMMRGYKWKAFVLDLSFIGWLFVTVLTFGIAGIFFVNPYRSQTEAEFYWAVRQEAAARNPELYRSITESDF